MQMMIVKLLMDRPGLSQLALCLPGFEPGAFPVQGGRYARFNYRPMSGKLLFLQQFF